MLYMMAMVLLLPIMVALLKIELQTELNTSQYWIGILKSHQNMQLKPLVQVEEKPLH